METENLKLDADQQRAVDHDGGPLLVVGGPGTGKTTVLVERWVRLATSIVEPHRVLLLVPVRERALALRDELPWRLDDRAIVEVPVHTWHALAYHLVTRYYGKLGYAQPPIRLTTAEQSAVVRELLAAEDPAPWGSYGSHLLSDALVSEVADFCVRAGHRGLTDDDLRALAAERPEHAAVATFALRYRDDLRAKSALDYAELVAAATRLLESDAGIREAVRRRFTHILVDDAQELAPAQLAMLRCLNTERLVCTGDPDSAIEAFRGADPRWLDRFSELAPSHDRITLPVCHRFGDSIGVVTRSLIAHGGNADHRPHTFTSHDTTAHVRCYATMAGEIEAAARQIRSSHLVHGIPYERMAILLAQPSTYVHPLKRVLSSLDVPYRIDSGDRPLDDEPSVRGVLDLCRAALSPDVEDDLMKAVLNSILIGLHPYEIRELEREAFRRNAALTEVVDHSTLDGVGEFRRLRDLVRDHSEESADATFLRIFEASRCCRQLVEARRTDRDASHQLDALIEFSRALAHFVERRPGAMMVDYLNTSSGVAFTAQTWPGTVGRDGVHIISFHASKGAEWDVVCVLGVAEGLIPRVHRAQGLFDPWALEAGSPVDRHQAQLAEERRTLYVALSRAREHLTVSCSPGTRRATPSRFLEEAFGTLPEPIVPGDEQPPLTLDEAAAQHRRTLALPGSSEYEKSAAAAALAAIPGLDPRRWWWRRDYTEGAALTPDGKMTTSYSRIGRYDNCPLQFLLESVLGLDPASTYQMKFGSLVHRILERVDRGEITSLEQAQAVYKEEFLSHHREDYPNIQFARTYYTAGMRMLKLWWKTERPRGEVVAVEYSFNDLDVDGHTIRGRIDRITKDNGGLVLTDYKTSRSAVSYDEARESLQLAIYYRAAQVFDDLRGQGRPARMELVYPGIEKRDWQDGSVGCDRRTQRPEEAEEALVKLRKYLSDAAAERFDASPEADCRWCRMKMLCPRWPEGKEVPR